MSNARTRTTGIGLVVFLIALAVTVTGQVHMFPDASAGGPTMGYHGMTPPNVYTVGSRGDYPTIQAAVNAVTGPDSVVLVESGFSTLQGFVVGPTVPGRLLVTSDSLAPAHVFVNSAFAGGIHVYDRGPGQTTEIRGFTVTTDDPGPAVVVGNCEADVVLSDVEIYLYSYPAAIDVIDCDRLAIQRCDVRGVNGVRASGSDVMVLDSQVLGGCEALSGTTMLVCEVVGPKSSDSTSIIDTTFGQVPDLWMQRVVNPGASFEYYIHTYPHAAWYLYISTDVGRVETSNPLVSLVGLLDESTASLLTAGMTGPTGHAYRGGPFPNDPSLLGTRWVASYIVFNPAGAYRWSNVESFVVMP